MTTHTIESAEYGISGLDRLIEKIERPAHSAGFPAHLSTLWRDCDLKHDYFNLRDGARYVDQFEILLPISEFILQTSRELAAQHIPDARADVLIAQHQYHVDAIQKNHRDQVAWDKRNPGERSVSIGPFETFLYAIIVDGVKPWPQVASFYEKLTKAVRENPPEAIALMLPLGMDIIAPNFPAIDSTQIKQLADFMDEWHEQKDNYSDGIDFFVKALHRLGVSTQDPEESSDAYWSRIIQLMPSLEQHVDYNLPPDEMQKDVYYMQVVFGLQNHDLLRRIQFNEHNETIACVIVRKSDATILAAKTNKSTDENTHKHAEILSVEAALEAKGEPGGTLADCICYVSCDPCQDCGPKLVELGLEVRYGANTVDGSGLFPNNGGLLQEQFDDLFRKQLHWDPFVQ